eukprot:3562322-Pleurochrysis_carterae.AAC.1
MLALGRNECRRSRRMRSQGASRPADFHSTHEEALSFVETHRPFPLSWLRLLITDLPDADKRQGQPAGLQRLGDR